ncbi:MAG: DNA polymerase III subunit delta' [Rhizobacter sp.]
MPLSWLAEPLRAVLETQRAHAILIHGPQGVGQFEMALTLAQSWLCDSPPSQGARPCGICASCRLVQSRSHPDLMVLVPEALREALGWSTDDAGEEGGSSKGEASGKRKPSKDIRVDEVRRIVTFAQTTAARAHGKVVVVFPAERMNGVSANALLKTLEEPPGNLRFALAGASADALLPTIRSRCQAVRLGLPDTAVAAAWLQSRGVTQPEVLLAAAGGQPEEALNWFREGLDARAWLALPEQLARGEVAGLTAWPLPRVIDMLFKLCHDAMRATVGAAPRYFPSGLINGRASIEELTRWYREIGRVARHAEHPWQAALTIELLVTQAHIALTVPNSTTPILRVR